MAYRLITIMADAPDNWSDERIASEARRGWIYFGPTSPLWRPIFSKAVTIDPEKVADKAAIIFGETIRPEGEGRGE